jgi:hypothetical protein
MSIQCTIPLLAFQLLHSTSFYTPESCSTATPISSLFCIHIVFVHLVHAISPCFCMLSPYRVLYLIIMPTLQLLWKLNACAHHHWVLFRDSFTSPIVETLRLLCYSRSQLSIAVTGFNTLPNINRLYDQSSSHWKIP